MSNEHKVILARGLSWMFIWLGFGGCCLMTHWDNKEPLVLIRNESKQEASK